MEEEEIKSGQLGSYPISMGCIRSVGVVSGQ